MVAIKEWYRRVNEAWPEPVPAMTFAQGSNAARRLFRWALGETFTGTITETSGARHNKCSYRRIIINPRRGWKSLLHTMSHRCWRMANVGEPIRPHERGHAKLELRMIKEVIKRGWLQTEATQSKPVTPSEPKHDLRVEKLIRTEALIAKWETKLKRAQTALKKLSRRKRYYERTVQRLGATIH